MTEEATSRRRPGVFGNLTVPRHSGIYGLSLFQSLSLVPLVLVCIVLMAFQQWLTAFTLVFIAGLMFVIGKFHDRNGRTVYNRVGIRIMHWWKKKSNKDVYIAGPTGVGTPDGATRLPGLLARSELSEWPDAFDNAFGLLRVSSQGVHNYSVVFECYPDGGSLIDVEQSDQRVASWAAWLTQLGNDDTIRGAQVVIESAPDPGLRITKLLNANRSDDAPAFSDDVVNEIRDSFVGGAPQLQCRITLTFDGKRGDGSAKDRGTEDMAEEIGNKLPSLVAGLASSGAGHVRLCTAQDIIDATRAAYDPTVAAQIEEAQGTPEGTGLSWEEAGPSFQVDGFDTLQHDRAVSRSWTMWKGPQGHFRANCLQRILEPSPNALRKRVTLLYRPIPSARAESVVEKEQRDASFAGSQKRFGASARMRQAAADATAEEQSLGAGLTRFGMIVTVTTRDADELKVWDRQVPAMLSAAKLRIRTALANQAVTFQAGLPLGTVLSDHMMLPESVRKGMQ